MHLNNLSTQSALETISTLFESVTFPEKWPEALQMLAHLGGAKYSLLFFDDSTNPHLINKYLNHHSKDIPKDIVDEYFKKYGHIDLKAVEYAIENDRSREYFMPFVDTEAFDVPGGLSHPVFNEFRYQANYFRRAAVILGRNEPWNCAFLAQFAAEQEIYPTGSLEIFRELAPFIERAVISGRVLMKLQAKYSQIISALDKLKIGTAIITGNRDIVVMNTAFQQLLSESDVFSISMDRKLKVPNTTKNSRIEQAIDKACQVGARVGLDQGATLAGFNTNDLDPISIEITPLSVLESETSNTGFAVIYAINPQWNLVNDPGPLVEAYSLSKAESKNLRYLLEGLNYSDIADIRGVSRDTIKSQISSILRKTNATNRSDLSRLAAASVIPTID